MLKGYPRLALGFIWLGIGAFCLVVFLSDRHSLDFDHVLRRWLFAGLVGLVGGPVMILWGGSEMMFRRRPKGGGVFERDGLEASHMADVTDGVCTLARADGSKPSPATVSAATHAINAYFACDFSEAAVADRIARYSPSPKEDQLAMSIRHGFPSMDERFRADFVRALFDVAKADGAISPSRARAFALLFVAIKPPAAAGSAEMQALLSGPVPH